MMNCNPWEGLTFEHKKSARRKQQQRGTVTDRCQLPFLIPLHCWGFGREGDRRVGSEGEEVSLGRSGGGLLGFIRVSHHPTVFLIGKELNQFSISEVCFAHDSN